MIQLCWMPTWSCQNYSREGDGRNHACPYCPLGLRDGRLTFNGTPGSANGTVDPKVMISFLLRHREIFGDQITISGGEPLTAPALIPVLKGIAQYGFKWGITSNTLLHKPLAKLSAELSGFASCNSWTASFHPASPKINDDFVAFADNARFLRLNGCRWLYCNLVASCATISAIESCIEKLHDLPFDRINLLVDMYQHTEAGHTVDRAIAMQEKYPGRIMAVGSGKTIKGVKCATTGRFLVASPTGVIYQCVRKCYQEIDPIGNIEETTISTNNDGEWCGLDCPHTCDQVKHIKGSRSGHN